MRYWAYLAGKLVVAAVPSYGLLRLVVSFFPRVERDDYVARMQSMQADLIGYLWLLAWFSFTAGLIYLVVWDQRRRCRVCLHRLRMPVETGSWGYMLQLGRPRIEYICPYGHGTLTEEELQISGLANPEWTGKSGDFWDELYASSKDAGKDS